jgi:transcription elongation GreA/GreB family factor
VSKAFTKEDDDAPIAPQRRLGVPVPIGVPNLITPAGMTAIRAELRDAEGERARELADHVATAQEFLATDRDRVGFGARVTVEDDAGRRTTYHLVGAIEAAPKHGAISWQSPIAKALVGAAIGDEVVLPRGTVTIVAIDY